MHDIAKVAFPRWLNQKMEMIKEKNVSQYNKWVNFFHIMKDLTQQIHVPGIMKNRFTILNNLCNKYRWARNIITMKVHKQIIAAL